MDAVKRTVLVTAHTGRAPAVESARRVIQRFLEAGFTVRVMEQEAEEIAAPGVDVVPARPSAAEDAEVMMVLGGDGTLLRAAELARPAGTPLLGVNLGHVGFLAEAEMSDLAEAVDRVVNGHYTVEERMTIEVRVRANGEVLAETWALNEASVEKRDRMLEVVAEIDGHPLSRWGCDGVICATPTGSTAYAFSAGGPVVWPEVEALLLVPNSAHALFARPLVVSPRSAIALEILPGTGAVLWCDGRRRFDLPPGVRVEVRRDALPVRLARLHGADTTGAPFTDRLVAKFDLPVQGWRGRARR
ncbi:NAD kinase 2 [Sphaerisporangium krabiense]|uniref:NAD kinase n=1 Tax=Sphaerisporangium krabiense TaxID=763782 RepID=A0A7W9DTS5_9ACTN|nr:NAD kinase [Sphaerisporangium krabiense]MBB5630936.1 NAD+ kinase [Sphaerisporangium krabiense]GII65817.1 NAD kinase 2 [Sphaerisporangium krabiense]